MPTTVLRDGPFGPGSVQRFINFDPAEHFFTLEVEHAETFRRVAMFDLAVNNADRKGGHCLLDEDGEIWVIDHGVCFAVEPKLRTVIWTFVDEPLPADAVEDLARIRDDLNAGGEIAATLGALLAAEEVAATADRIDRLLEAGRFPEPEPGVRPFPWPPIGICQVLLPYSGGPPMRPATLFPAPGAGMLAGSSSHNRRAGRSEQERRARCTKGSFPATTISI